MLLRVPVIAAALGLAPALAAAAGSGCRDSASPANASAGSPAGPSVTTSTTTATTTAPSDAAVASAVRIGVEDDGKTFDVAVGAVIAFALASHAGTGYIWVPTRFDANVVTQEGDRTSETDADVPGAPKEDRYRFTAKATGTTPIEMALKRPFGSASAGRTLRVILNVQ